MSFFTGFFKGFGNCFKAFDTIFNKGLWPFLFYPLVIWALTWLLSIYGILVLADFASEAIKEWLSFENIPDSGHWLSFAKPFLSGTIGFMAGLAIKIIFWFISGTITKYIILMVMSPLFALLSEKAEEKLTGKSFPFSFVQLLKDIVRGVLISLRNMCIELSIITIVSVITFFAPFIGILTAPLLLFVSWYFIGFTMMDYSCERHKLKIRESLRFIRSNMGLACGIGCVYWLFMNLPFFTGDIIGMMFGPSLAVVGATLSFLEIRKAA